MQSEKRFYLPGLCIAFLVALLVSGCSAGSGTGASGSPVANGGTPTSTGSTPAPASCAPHTTATAEAWATSAAHPQVMGSINGAPAARLSNFTYPLGLPSEGRFGNDYLVALAWAPDAQHLAAAMAVNDGPGQLLFPYIVDTKSHAVTLVKLPDGSGIPERAAANRVFAWADNHTLLIFGAFSGGNNGSSSTVSYSYDITSSSLTPLPGVTTAYEGVVRCSTLFYLEITALTQIDTSGSYKGAGRLHRYDLASHSEIGSPITLGDTSTFRGAEGYVTLMGWDVSPDGSRIAYQQTSVSLGANTQIVLTSKFYAANADGSGAVPILTGAISNTPAFLAISPDSKQVAVTNAAPTPTVLSGSMSGGAAHFYQPDAQGPPVWMADSTHFEADSLVASAQGIARWSLNTAGGRQPGSVVHPNVGIPATLP